MKRLFLLFVLLFLVGCSSSIADVKVDENVGKSVVVSGVVESPIKIGKLSGYTLVDDSGSIRVSSENLPAEGDSVSVRGVLIKDSLLGYYIKVQ